MRPPPDVFAAVMATGIVSIAGADHGHRWISLGLAVIAGCGLPVLVVVCAVSWRRSPLDVHDPDVLLRLFTYVAACAVLGARLAEYRVALWVLAGLALQFWLTLAPVVVRRMWRIRWTGLRDRAHGAWELASVATSGLAILSADLRWLFGALLFWALALLVYGVITGLMLWRALHERLDRDGFEPDSWILMGALAIATLAGDHIHRMWASEVVEAVTVLTWVLATLWIPVLVHFGIRRINSGPGRLRFRGVWWAMVFPLGMYAAATQAMSFETGWRGLHTVSLVFFWVAFAAWVTVAVGAVMKLQSHHGVTGIDG
ncbi:tellurite resistance/C4-dicarboxylate transporter family protein [Mycobacterium sp. CVI_P3]|uniref:Tellurite resistance/C4-dicarboxylate transporter family protein n=1 Tax=Mycobacterium pinniadriaticum TaxID=2994102 RepID=A0ABT3S8M5_9MYCO|nr:tellurite resistance/C4-dicarboxylate transporter family protein [Mycobacterium pinniadriaticum]MCX2928843.1 tellurite resistance/C4-dicarboxylate transporter family protein [Mycobacterium pinniadriaticum]MCX2935290.1 tellurite resistance/C4-dicarboxylate transporter family protein [Mycobacterium pinniadriaticum]